MTPTPPRLTRTMLTVLQYLQTATKPDTSGAAIQKATRVGTASLYPILAQLESVGWIGAEWEVLAEGEPVRPRRRYYHLTPSGRHAAHEALAAQDAVSAAAGLPGFAALPA